MAFLDNKFMIHNEYGQKLYDNYSKDQPIYDYHNHLDPQLLFENNNFENITEAWLAGDHYKWRVMRAFGIEEELVTGDGSDYDKFKAWASVVPHLIGNPLFHWAQLELKMFFGIEKILNPDTADEIWEETNEKLKQDDFKPRALLDRMNVVAMCTTDDPIDTLEYHKKLEESDWETKVRPTFRPDNAVNIHKPAFVDYIPKLEDAADMKIEYFDDLTAALENRIDYFHESNCRISDHGLDSMVYEKLSKEELDNVLQKGRNGEELTDKEVAGFITAMLTFLAGEYDKRDWVMQLHIGAVRNNSKRLFEALGPDVGNDGINDRNLAEELGALMSDMEERGLPRTILYTLNPKDYYSLSTVGGCFQNGNTGENRIQVGTAWWFLDTHRGMEEQMEIIAETGVFSQFVGMLTDSRSILSFVRHDYFRRIMCNFVGGFVEREEYPWDEEFLGQMVEDISFNNSKKFIKLV